MDFIARSTVFKTKKTQTNNQNMPATFPEGFILLLETLPKALTQSNC